MKSIIVTLIVGLVLSACGGAAATPTSTAEPTLAMPATVPVGTASFEVSGQLAASVERAVADYTFLPDVMRHRMLIHDPEGDYFVLFILPEVPESGVHDLVPSGQEYDQPGIYMAAFTPALADEMGVYDSGVNGTLTLDVAEGTISGSYTFSAQNQNGEQVSVSGSFSGIPLVVG